MSWWTTVAYTQFTIPPGMEMEITDPRMVRIRTGDFPSLMVHQEGRAEPEIGIVPDPRSTSQDLEHLAQMAREWARHLDEAARVRSAQEDSDPYRDAG